MEYLKRNGELTERKEVESLSMHRIMAVRQGLINLSLAHPYHLLTSQDQLKMDAVIAKAVRELLAVYSRPLSKEVAAKEQSTEPEIYPRPPVEVKIIVLKITYFMSANLKAVSKGSFCGS